MNKYTLIHQQFFCDDNPVRLLHVHKALLSYQEQIKELNDIIERKDKEIKKTIEENAELWKEFTKSKRKVERLIAESDEGIDSPS